MRQQTETLPVELLRREVKKRGTQKAVALWLGVDDSYVCEILKGTRNPGPGVLEKLGLQKIEKKEVTYRPIRRQA